METLILKKIKNAIRLWYIPLFVGLFFVIVGIITFASPGRFVISLSHSF